MSRPLTAAQQRALEWLPFDGAWATRIPRAVSGAVDSLVLSHRELAEHTFGPVGPKGGWGRKVRLTDKGVMLRGKLAATREVAE